jgi:hypothetical protein
MSQFFGKFRGTVINNIDPNQMGRLQVSCPQVLGLNLLSWAMPCVPFAGIMEGFYMLPMIGSNVWVEFEAGDPDRPIWSGCFWGQGQLPPAAVLPTVRTIKTSGGELTLDDTPGAGGITVQAGPPVVAVPCSVKLSASGIEITIGGASIKLDPARVNINNGALEVI